MRSQVKISPKTRSVEFDSQYFKYLNGRVSLLTNSKTIGPSTTPGGGNGGITVVTGSWDGIVPGSNNSLKICSLDGGTTITVQTSPDGGTTWVNTNTQLFSKS